MTNSPIEQSKSKALQEILRIADLMMPHYQYVWEHLLTVSEKTRIGISYEECRRSEHIANLWAKQRKLSVHEAVLDLAERLWLSPQLAERLRQRAGLKPQAARMQAASASLQYHADSGQLTNGSEVLGVLGGQAKNCRALLEAFQKRDWQDWVPNPLPNDDPKRLEDTVALLNRKLGDQIRFHVSGQGASWEKL